MATAEHSTDLADAHHPKHHFLRSHAHEGEIPGTVNVQAVEGDDTYLGQALYPVPAEDPNDPLQWPMWKKTMILIVCSAYSFLGNSALVGPSVYIGIYSNDFNVTPDIASNLISYPNLAFGFGMHLHANVTCSLNIPLILVPMYLKFGRRPVMLGSILIFIAGLAGASRATTFAGLMVARVIHGFGSGVCEALPVQLVNDIFFLHERGKRIGYYTVCLCLGSTGPLYAGYMLAGGFSWRLYFYVELAFAGALFVLAFLFVEETMYKRVLPGTRASTPSLDEGKEGKEGKATDAKDVERTSADIPPRKTFIQSLKPWSHINHEAEFFMTAIRSFTYFFVPAVFWVITTYGIYIGLGALTFNFTFPLLITAPPYNWSQTNSGLIAVATIIGYGLAIPFTSTSDRLAAYLTRRNNGVREAEMRLGVLLPVMLLAPAGLILYGFAAEKQLPWIAYFVGVALNQFCSYFYFTFTVSYAVDSYYANTSEMLIAMNLGKQAISFAMGIKLLDWILQHGYAVMISGAFCALVLANNLAVLIFLFFGKRIRIATSKGWLARLHKNTMGEAMTH